MPEIFIAPSHKHSKIKIIDTFKDIVIVVNTDTFTIKIAVKVTFISTDIYRKDHSNSYYQWHSNSHSHNHIYCEIHTQSKIYIATEQVRVIAIDS